MVPWVRLSLDVKEIEFVEVVDSSQHHAYDQFRCTIPVPERRVAHQHGPSRVRIDHVEGWPRPDGGERIPDDVESRIAIAVWFVYTHEQEWGTGMEVHAYSRCRQIGHTTERRGQCRFGGAIKLKQEVVRESGGVTPVIGPDSTGAKPEVVVGK